VCCVRACVRAGVRAGVVDAGAFAGPELFAADAQPRNVSAAGPLHCSVPRWGRLALRCHLSDEHEHVLSTSMSTFARLRPRAPPARAHLHGVVIHGVAIHASWCCQSRAHGEEAGAGGTGDYGTQSQTVIITSQSAKTTYYLHRRTQGPERLCQSLSERLSLNLLLSCHTLSLYAVQAL
jgi:hypothetical protein